MTFTKNMFDTMSDFLDTLAPLATRCANDFIRKTGTTGYYPDYIQEGMLTLIKFWDGWQEGNEVTTTSLYQKIYHDLYALSVNSFFISIPRNQFNKEHDKFCACVEERSNECPIYLDADIEYKLDIDLFKEQLSPREREVLDCLLRGMNRAEIARDCLGCVAYTVTRLINSIGFQYDVFFGKEDVG